MERPGWRRAQPRWPARTGDTLTLAGCRGRPPPGLSASLASHRARQRSGHNGLECSFCSLDKRGAREETGGSQVTSRLGWTLGASGTERVEVGLASGTSKVAQKDRPPTGAGPGRRRQEGGTGKGLVRPSWAWGGVRGEVLVTRLEETECLWEVTCFLSSRSLKNVV